MKIKNYRHLLALVVGGLVTIVAYVLLVKSSYFAPFQAWSQHHLVWFVVILFFIKVIGIVWPPIPGGLLTLGAIPIIGWLPAYMADFAGSMLGSTVAFFLAKHWGRHFMEKLFDEVTVQKVLSIKVRPHREIESVIMFRVFGGTIIEAVCYGAGLLGIKYRNFFIGSVLAHLVFGVPVFYLLNQVVSGRDILLNVLFVGVGFSILVALRKRYFEIID
jgi:uncharacterized membrane protein YdjX (TVP38/TMEM64 family)